MAGWNRVEKARSRIAGVLTRIIKVISDQSQGDGKKPIKLPWSGSVNSIVNRLRSKIMAFFLHTGHFWSMAYCFQGTSKLLCGSSRGSSPFGVPRSGLTPMIEANNSIVQNNKIQS